ncbi:hypothetical protein HKT18_12140 [Flavobacterium sp. IMCC34852]|uniref:DoxX family protein n=1 Tax=Flavobacterium rivulicola TaxID=2732161 RepID=A0A7Y3RBA6_9FLAO|nr:hypothetical protein [Flavobacterium sp. IMCC34852]NNT72970.1 hypothetical protein [Flavobacterium sp. IMCC34852]
MKKTIFRFFFIYFILSTALWQIFEFIPGLSAITYFINDAFVPVVTFFNDHIFHVKDKLNIDGGGSGDTSYAWAYFYNSILLATLGTILWTLLERKPKDYSKLDWWLKNTLRYYLIIIAFLYGTIKLFAMQMPEPNLSELATPLGDYLPMRLSWMFFGYSSPYQIFSGVMEIMVAILLLYRRTITMGLLLGFGVFLNVFILNLCFDIPVKIFSMHLVIYCLYLIISDANHFVNFFWRNIPSGKLNSYYFSTTNKYFKIFRIVVKTLIILVFGVFSTYQSWEYKQEFSKSKIQKPIEPGVYYTTSFKKNNVEIPISLSDDKLWKDFIFQDDSRGSILTSDTLFRQAYNRGYFSYQVKPKENKLIFTKLRNDKEILFESQYKVINPKSIQISTKIKNDSLVFTLEKSNRNFQLMEKQFHWISEANR